MPEVAVVVGQVETPSNHSSTFWVYVFHGGNLSSSTLCKSHVNWGAYKRNTLGTSQNAGEWSLTLVKSTKEPCGESCPFHIPRRIASPCTAWGIWPTGHTIYLSCSDWACFHEEHACPCLAGKQTNSCVAGTAKGQEKKTQKKKRKKNKRCVYSDRDKAHRTHWH